MFGLRFSEASVSCVVFAGRLGFGGDLELRFFAIFALRGGGEGVCLEVACRGIER